MAIGKDGNWVNADRSLDDSNYMSIAEWCAWTTRVAAELLDKGASGPIRHSAHQGSTPLKGNRNSC